MKRNEMLKKINELGLQGKFSKEHNGMSYTYAQTYELSEFLSNNGVDCTKTEKQGQTKDSVDKQVIVLPVNLLFTREKLKKANELDEKIEDKRGEIIVLQDQLDRFNEDKSPLVWLEKGEMDVKGRYAKQPIVRMPGQSRGYYGEDYECQIYIPHKDCKEFVENYINNKISKINDEITKLEEEFTNINFE